MRRHGIIASLDLHLGVAVLVLAAVFLYAEQNAAQQTKEPQAELDFSRFPIADFYYQGPSEPALKAVREVRARKYNSKVAMQPISEAFERAISLAHWDSRLPALPINKSAAVVIGQVTDAQAYLSEDRTAIYSEFKIDIANVVKDDSEYPIGVDKTLSVLRGGGRLRMPSGKIAVSWVNHQDMPRVGGRYVLFLSHSFETVNDMGNDFHILTGYELRNSKVFPLDDSGVLKSYTGRSESAFLKDLFTSTTQTP